MPLSYIWWLLTHEPLNPTYILGVLTSRAGQGLRPVSSPYHIHDGSDSVNDTLMTQATDGYWKLHLPAAIAVFLSIEPSDSDLPHNHHWVGSELNLDCYLPKLLTAWSKKLQQAYVTHV